MTNLKNIVIGALLAINVFFLAVYLLGVYRDNADRSEAHRNLAALMHDSGIELDTKAIREGGSLFVLETRRHPESEAALADALLGPAEASDRGGNITAYRGEKGEAVFRNSGEVAATLEPGRYPAAPSAESAARSVLKTQGLEIHSLSVSATGGGEAVTAVTAWRGRPLYNCTLRFSYRDGYLEEITGRLATGAEKTAEKADMSSAATALMGFLGGVKSGRYLCSRITSVEPGYFYVSVSAFGDGSLRPVWRIAADSGVYYVDALTGATEQSAG